VDGDCLVRGEATNADAHVVVDESGVRRKLNLNFACRSGARGDEDPQFSGANSYSTS
jgi:hypothetical protein